MTEESLRLLGRPTDVAITLYGENQKESAAFLRLFSPKREAQYITERNLRSYVQAFPTAVAEIHETDFLGLKALQLKLDSGWSVISEKEIGREEVDLWESQLEAVAVLNQNIVRSLGRARHVHPSIELRNTVRNLATFYPGKFDEATELLSIMDLMESKYPLRESVVGFRGSADPKRFVAVASEGATLLELIDWTGIGPKFIGFGWKHPASRAEGLLRLVEHATGGKSVVEAGVINSFLYGAAKALRRWHSDTLTQILETAEKLSVSPLNHLVTNGPPTYLEETRDEEN